MDYYIKRLYEQLQWCSQEDFSITDFFPYDQDISYDEELMYNQISIEFIYRCLKCDLIIFLNGSILSSDEIYSLEDYASFLSNSPIGQDEWKRIGTPLQNKVWTCEFFDGTNKLIKICEECGLNGYEEFDENDIRWAMFIDKVENIFSENNLTWNLDKPLFPVGNVSNNIL